MRRRMRLPAAERVLWRPAYVAVARAVALLIAGTVAAPLPAAALPCPLDPGALTGFVRDAGAIAMRLSFPVVFDRVAREVNAFIGVVMRWLTNRCLLSTGADSAEARACT